MVKVLKAQSLPSTTQNTAAGTIVSATAKGIDVACGDGVLRILEAQVPGKKPQPVATLVNGYADIFSNGKQLS